MQTVYLYDEQRQYAGMQVLEHDNFRPARSTPVAPPELNEHEIAVYAGNGRWCKHVKPSVLTAVLSDVEVACEHAQLVGNIWWLPRGEAFTLSAHVGDLPDTQLMVMVERVVNAEQPVDDMRFVANVANGVLTMQGCFELSGNYLITAQRLNAGLERIGASYRFAFDALEFDAYVPQ
ncbi:hypothetical protein [Pseudoalteromonas sp. T1lg23B]|uniref:hypothetical protein n=1 Tax=Pseudoalteromonas sp. T1lg23B TaxID=2077097 RepID=UPI000CF65ED5|nr:hypothetical protein [Pseudoalteromonas sp. T1lg23B]